MIIKSITLAHNDTPYLWSTLSSLKMFCDECVVIDDGSIDGIEELINSLGSGILYKKQDFKDDFSQQRNFALKFINEGDWVISVDGDEVPSVGLINGLREILEEMEEKTDWAYIRIFHLNDFYNIKSTVGKCIRIFKMKNDTRYTGAAHEIVIGTYSDKTCVLPNSMSLLHFKFMDLNKIETLKTDYVNRGFYSPDHVSRLLRDETTALPSDVDYILHHKTKSHLNGFKENLKLARQ